MNGAWMNDASGSQWAFDGIGRTGVDRELAADLGEDPDEVDVEPVAAGERPRDIDVIEGIGVGRIREHEHESGPDEDGEPVQEQGDSHGRCRVAPRVGPAD